MLVQYLDRHIAGLSFKGSEIIVVETPDFII